MAKEKKGKEETELEAGKPGETLEQLQDQIERQAQDLVKRATEQEGKTVTQEAAPQEPQPAQVAPRTISLDEAGAKTSYSNFCYTAGTREGVLFGFGFHDWQPGNPIKVDAKVEMSYFNAKRLLATLNQVIKRHETAFGEIEIDVNKRLKIKPASGTGGAVA
jgi:hypothetical protein